MRIELEVLYKAFKQALKDMMLFFVVAIGERFSDDVSRGLLKGVNWRKGVPVCPIVGWYSTSEQLWLQCKTPASMVEPSLYAHIRLLTQRFERPPSHCLSYTTPLTMPSTRYMAFMFHVRRLLAHSPLPFLFVLCQRPLLLLFRVLLLPDLWISRVLKLPPPR